MQYVSKVLGGIGILIILYLFLSKGDSAIKLFDTFMGKAINGLKELQGRG